MKHEALYRRCLSVTRDEFKQGMSRQQFIDHMVVKHGASIDDAVDKAIAGGWTEQKAEEFITSLLNAINIATE